MPTKTKPASPVIDDGGSLVLFATELIQLQLRVHALQARIGPLRKALVRGMVALSVEKVTTELGDVLLVDGDLIMEET
jgi:hypothetical protein